MIIKFFIYPNLIFDKFAQIELNKFEEKLNKHPNFQKEEDEKESDLIIIHVFEPKNLKLNSRKNIIAFIYFNPLIEEIIEIKEYLNDKCLVMIFSSFDLGKYFDNFLLINWPFTNNFKSQTNNTKNNSNNIELIEIKETFLKESLFNFEIINNLNLARIPICNRKTPYPSFLNKKLVKQSSIYDLINKNWNHLSWDFFIETIFETIKGKFITQEELFFPLLNIISKDNLILPNKSMCKEVCYNDDSKCYCTNNHIKQFYLWAITPSFNNPNEGLFISKKTLNNHELYPNTMLGCDNFYFLEIPKQFQTKMEISNFVFDDIGNKYLGCPPFTEWQISKNSLYIKKPFEFKVIEIGIITYIDNLDCYERFRNYLKAVKNIPITIYYDIELEIQNNDEFEMIAIDTIKFNEVPNLKLFIQLYVLTISKFKKCLYIDSSLWFNDKLDKIIEKLGDNEILFLASLENNKDLLDLLKEFSEYSYIFEKKELKMINTNLFLIDTLKCWYSIHICLGFLKTKINKNLKYTDIELLYLACLINNSKVKLYQDTPSINCYGYIFNDLFLGYPIYNLDTFKFTYLPNWIDTKKPSHLFEHLDKYDWTYSLEIDCLTTHKNNTRVYNFNF